MGLTRPVFISNLPIFTFLTRSLLRLVFFLLLLLRLLLLSLLSFVFVFRFLFLLGIAPILQCLTAPVASFPPSDFPVNPPLFFFLRHCLDLSRLSIVAPSSRVLDSSSTHAHTLTHKSRCAHPASPFAGALLPRSRVVD